MYLLLKSKLDLLESPPPPTHSNSPRTKKTWFLIARETKITSAPPAPDFKLQLHQYPLLEKDVLAFFSVFRLWNLWFRCSDLIQGSSIPPFLLSSSRFILFSPLTIPCCSCWWFWWPPHLPFLFSHHKISIASCSFVIIYPALILFFVIIVIIFLPSDNNYDYILEWSRQLLQLFHISSILSPLILSWRYAILMTTTSFPFLDLGGREREIAVGIFHRHQNQHHETVTSSQYDRK